MITKTAHVESSVCTFTITQTAGNTLKFVVEKDFNNEVVLFLYPNEARELGEDLIEMARGQSNDG